MINIKQISELIRIPEEDILNIYVYGSRVYGTLTEKSDWDFIVVVKSKYRRLDGKNVKSDNGLININLYNVRNFYKKIYLHEISVLECLFVPEDKILKKTLEFKYKIDPSLLRETISRKSSLSFVKAKKKFEVEKDFNPYIAKKSLFHSMRMVFFAIQLIKNGKITDFSEANYLWKEIAAEKEEKWDFYKEKYQFFYNKLMSEFRLIAPKSN